MSGRTPNWATFAVRRRARKNGTEDATGTKEGPTSWFSRQSAAAERTKAYLLSTPTRTPQSQIERELDAIGAARAPREKWLRGVLDACED